MSALATTPLAGTIASAIADEEALRPSKLAWVSEHFLIIRNADRQNHTIIPLIHLVNIDVVKTPYSGLLAIAAGVFIVAAAALSSKQGDGAAVPCALLGAFLIAAYFGSRRAMIKFKLSTGAVETTSSTISEATKLIELIEEARGSVLSQQNETGLATVTPLASGKKRKSASRPVFETSAAA